MNRDIFLRIQELSDTYNVFMYSQHVNNSLKIDIPESIKHEKIPHYIDEFFGDLPFILPFTYYVYHNNMFIFKGGKFLFGAYIPEDFTSLKVSSKTYSWIQSIRGVIFALFDAIEYIENKDLYFEILVHLEQLVALIADEEE